MTRLTCLRRRALAGSVLPLVCLLSAGLTAGQGVLGSGVDKSNSYRTFKDPAGRFEIEYPNKDWKLLPSGPSSLATFNHKDGPMLYIERLHLEDPLTPEEAAALPDAEVDRLKGLEPNVKDFKSDPAETQAGRGVLIRYSRIEAGESVMQLSILADPKNLYRLIGIVANKLMPKFEPVVKYMFRSFLAKA